MKTSNRHKKTKITFVLVGLVAAIALISATSTRAATWTQKADMPTPRWGHSAAVVNGKIYVIGGLTSETSFLNGKPILAVEEYDPATDTWTRKADMPEPRGYLYGSHPVVDGRIYVVGGAKSSAIARVDVYEPATDTWSRAADMPTPRMLLARVAWDGKIYAFGGKTGVLSSSAPTVNVTEVYDPQTDTWTQATPMPTRVWEHSAIEVDDEIYVIGGATGQNSIQILQVYDPQTDFWTNATPKPLNTRGFAAAEVCGKIYAFGGWLNSGQRPYSDTWAYEPITDTWTPGTPLPDFRATLSTSAVNGKIYAIGGTPKSHNLRATSTVYELDLELGFAQPDINGDGIVDGVDFSVIVDHWHTDEPSCDIAPAPCGDGIVDVQDLVLLSEYLLKEVNDPTLVAHWALDEAEGDIAHDSVGDNLGFVIGGRTWEPDAGRAKGAIQLDGVDDVIVAGPPLNPGDGPFSTFIWIKGGSAGQAIISEPAGPDWLSLDPLTGHLMTEFANNGRTGGPLLSQAEIADGNWHRIGFVWDGSNRTIYVDGVAVAADPQDALVNPGSGLYIGTGKDMAPGTYFGGMIDDVRIYSRAVHP